MTCEQCVESFVLFCTSIAETEQDFSSVLGFVTVENEDLTKSSVCNERCVLFWNSLICMTGVTFYDISAISVIMISVSLSRSDWWQIFLLFFLYGCFTFCWKRSNGFERV